MEKFGKWLLTDAGKSFSGGVSLTAGVSGFLAYLVPQGFCIERLKNFYQVYQNGQPKVLDPVLEKRASEVMEISQFDRQKGQFQFFAVNSCDMYSAGCVQTRWGAIVGIPNTFGHRDRGDIKNTTSMIRNQEIDWESEDGRQLHKSLLLSEKAQRYGIAREVQRSLAPHVYLYGGLSTLVIGLNFVLCRHTNRFYNLYKRDRMIRLALYSLMSAFNLTIFIALHDSLTHYLENRVDEKVAALGRDYVEGGIEFYQKMINRNLAIRKILGAAGEKIYSTNGNVNTMIRTPHIPITYRLEFLNAKLKELNDTTDKVSGFA